MITYSHKKTRGMSLIELLVAIAIGLLLLTGAVTMLMNNKRMYRTQNELGRVQENARYTVERMLNDISMAGYIGCSGDASAITNNISGVSSGDDYDLSNFIEGFESAATTWAPSGKSTSSLSPVAGTDGITVRSMTGSTFTLETPYVENKSDPVYVPADSGFKDGDYVTISDCRSTDLFKVSLMTEIDTNSDTVTDKLKLDHDNTVNTTSSLGNSYNEANTAARRMRVSRYYIGNGAKGFGLFRNDEELIEGVSDMEILYGIDNDSNGTADAYKNASAVGSSNWSKVVSVKLSLTFNIIDRDYTDVAPEPWVYTTTVNVRNNAINSI